MIPAKLIQTIIEFENKHKGWKFKTQILKPPTSQNLMKITVNVNLNDPMGAIAIDATELMRAEATQPEIDEMILSLVVELVSKFYVEQAKKNNQYVLRKETMLYDKYSANLSRMRRTGLIQITPAEDDIFACPLCLRVFERDDLNNKIITGEHLPPDRLGGKIRTLTCKSCNNSHGTILDAALVEFTKDVAFLSGDLDLKKKGILSKEDGTNPIAVNLSNRDAHANIELVPKASHSIHFNTITQALQSAQDLLHLSFSLESKFPYPDIALLRVAYLWGFSVFGYDFINHSNMTVVRNQINSPQMEILPSHGIWFMDFPDSTLGINLIVEPQNLRSFFVVFDVMISKRKFRYGVMLPGPTKSGLEVYEARKKLTSSASISFELAPLENEINLVRYPMEARTAWLAYFS